MQNNENIWKVLKFSSTSCLSQPNLNMSDKASLIYNGQPISTGYRVFLDSLQNDSFTDECSIIRIFPDVIEPKNRTMSNVIFRFEILSHTKVQYLDGYMNRNVYLLQQILQCLNGVDKIPNLGRLVFDVNDNRLDIARLNISNNRSFTGYTLLMSTFTK